jgi:hypothetical protein
MRLEDLAFFAQPMGARPVIGARTELGFPVYQDVGGNQFSVMPQAQQPSGDWSFGGVMNALAAPYRLARGMGSEQDAAAMQGVGNSLAQGLLAPGRAARGEMVTHGDAFATALDYGLLGAPMAAPEGALRANSFRAYHGSPHTFDRFSMDRIGTGEGAQAYGHGLYFAESEDVARGYRDALAGVNRLTAGNTAREGSIASRLAALFDNDGQNFVRNGRDISDIAGRLSTATEIGNDGEQIFRFSDGSTFINGGGWWDVSDESFGRGSLYEVQINADPNTFLDWDAPLSQQPEAVQGMTHLDPANPDITGQHAYRALDLTQRMPNGRLVNNWNPTAASNALNESGIPGIRYLDAGSRAAGDGSRNFVVFDDSLIQILRRYGIGAAAVGGGWAVTPEEYDAALAGEF